METIIGLFPPVAQLLEEDGERPSRRDGNSRGKVQNVPGNSSALRQQLAALTRTRNRPQLRTRDRLFWIVLAKS
jgi:hypothetical protein